MVKKSSSSRRWLKEHFSDPYVKQAKLLGYRSRAAFKLLEIQQRDRVFRSGMTVIDLGAAPGGWSQIVFPLVKPAGRVIAMDLLLMEPIEGVEFIQGDFSDDQGVQSLYDCLAGSKADWVISDMAPNLSGNESIDIPRAMYLAELALDFAVKIIKPDGGFLIKIFQGEGFDAFLTDLKRHFKKVLIRKPHASRGRSREVYIVARERK